MSLPIDPTKIAPEDIGEERTRIELPHEEAIEHVRDVCLEEGFGVPVEFSPSELLNEKVDADRTPYYVLGACNPSIANQCLDVTPRMGALFPCNFIIREIEPGLQEVHHVSIMRIARLVGIAPDSDEWEAIVTETGKLVEATYERLDSV